MNIVFVPDTRLRTISDDVSEEAFGEDLDAHMRGMLSKMRDMGGVGLAGIQVGDPRRILVAELSSGPALMVNPILRINSEDTVTFEEGCLSLPGFALDVERSDGISVEYKTPMGEAATSDLFGADAVIVQHEVDHLNGHTLLDKVSSLRRDIYLRKIKKLKRRIKMHIGQGLAGQMISTIKME